MKNQVLIDLSTITSAVNNPNPVLRLIDLSRLVEAIVLYDDVLYYGDPQDFDNGTVGHMFEDGLPSEVKEIIRTGPGVVDFGITTVPVAIHLGDTGEKIATGQQLVSSGSTPRYLDDENSPFLLEICQQTDFRLFSYATLYDQDMSEELKFKFVQVCATRAYYYMLAATKLKIPYNPQLFRVPIVRSLPLPQRTPVPYAIYRQFEDKMMNHIAKVAGVNRIEATLPLLFTYVIKEARNKDPYDIFRLAMELRKSKEMSRIREVFGKLNDSMDRFDLRLGGKMKRLLDEEADKVIKDLSGVQQSKLECKIKFLNLPDISIDFKTLTQQLKDRKLQKCIAQLGKISECSYQVLSLKSDIERVLNIRLSYNDEKFLISLSKKS